MFLEVITVAVGMVAIGLAVAAVSFLTWFGITLIIGIGAWWVVSMVKRHGEPY